MILPIVAYGAPILKRKCVAIEENSEALKDLIINMWETMYNAHGVGLAAPQINKSLRIFLVDTEQIKEDKDEWVGIKKAFINAQIIAEDGKEWEYEEGCLSIPNIRGDVSRKPHIKIQYLDENFNECIEEYDGINARVIQHEYDHIEGNLFLDYLKPLKKRLIKRKLENIRKGNIQADYRMKFVNPKFTRR